MGFSLLREDIVHEIVSMAGLAQNNYDNPSVAVLEFSEEHHESVKFKIANNKMFYEGEIPTFDVQGSGVIAINISVLNNIILNLTIGDILVCKVENNTFVVETSKSVFRIRMLNPRNLPTIPYFESDYSCIVDKKDFLTLVRKTKICIDYKNKNENNFNGLWFNVDEHNMKVLALSLQKIGVAKENIENISPYGREFQFSVDRFALGKSLYFLNAEKIVVFYYKKGNLLKLTDGTNSVYLKTIDKCPKSIDRFLKDENLTKEIKINRIDFLDVLKRISAISNDELSAVLLRINKCNIEVNSYNNEFGIGKEFIDAKNSNIDNFEILINVKNLIDILTVLNSYYVEFVFTNNNEHIFLLKETGRETVYILVPIIGVKGR